MQEPVRVRDRQGIYLGSILAAPLSQNAVTSYRHTKTQRQRQLVIGVDVVDTTAGT
jgi:hypothetical protein